MASEIRVNQIQSRTGVSTVSFTDSGPILAGVSTVQGSLTVDGNLNVDGVITYDDVTNVDSVGIITAQAGIRVTGGLVGIGSDDPQAPLNVVNTNSNTPTVWIRNTSGGGDSPALRVQGGANNNNAVGTFEVRDYDGNVDFKVGGTGSVGIGTASTDRVLAVYGTGINGTQLAIDAPDKGAAGIMMTGERQYEIQSTATNYGAAPASFIVYDRTANALRLGISSEGYVTKPNNPCFSATGSSSGTAVNANSSLTLPYDSEYFDVTSSYDHTNYKFTAPVAGKYFFYASVLNFPNTNSGYFTIIGAINGSASYAYGFARRNDLKLQNDVNFSTILNLSAGDTYEVIYDTASGSNYNYYLATGHARFFGYLVQ